MGGEGGSHLNLGPGTPGWGVRPDKPLASQPPQRPHTPHPHPEDTRRSFNSPKGRGTFSAGPARREEVRMGSPPPRKGRRTRRAGRRAAGGSAAGSPEPREQPNSSVRGRGGKRKKARSPRPGAAARWTHMAGGRRPPSSRGRGALTTCCLSPAEHPRRRTVLPSSPRSPTAAEPPRPAAGRGAQGPAGGGGLREDARRRARAARAAPALRQQLGRSAGAARGEPGLTGREEPI